MAFRNLTNSGKEYLATRLANELPVKFTKAKIGNGNIPLSTDPAQTTELYGFKKQVTILKAIQEQNSIKLTIQITNDEINEGFYLKEIGIYVDDNGREVLYWYCNEDNSQYVNAQTDIPLSFEVDIMMEVTNENSTVVEWTGKDTWINKELLKEEMAKKLNKGSLPATITDAKGIYDLLENNGGINIDTELIYLNDEGTKTQGKVYFDRNKKGLFECIKTTTDIVNSTEFFVNISNKASADRLSNLIENVELYGSNGSLSSTSTITKIKIFRFIPPSLDKKVGEVYFKVDFSEHFNQISFAFIGENGGSSKNTVNARINDINSEANVIGLFAYNSYADQSCQFTVIIFGN